MNKNLQKTMILKGIIFVVGIFITGLGVNVLLRAQLGAGAWDTVTYNLSQLINSSLGIASAIVNFFVLLVVILTNRKWKYLFVLIPIASIALAIDFWDLLVFRDFTVDRFIFQLLFYTIGAILLPLGLAVVMTSKLPAMVFDELTLALMRFFKVKRFFTMRIFIELFAIILASALGFAAGIGFGAVNVGSFILAFSIGPVISLHLKWLTPLVDPLITPKEDNKPEVLSDETLDF